MEISLQIDQPFQPQVDPASVIQAVQLVLRRYSSVENPTLTLVVTDETQIQQYNRDYRGIDHPTDVLSFESIPDQDFPGIDDNYLGDVVIAYPVAEKQAETRGHTAMQELVLLSVHGVLHLLGHDHDTAENKKQMWQLQREILTELELPEIQPTEN